MDFYVHLFNMLKKSSAFLQRKHKYLTNAGIIFFILIALFCILPCIPAITNLIAVNKLISFLLFLLILILILIPIANSKYKKSLITISHKSYFFFSVFLSVLIWGAMNSAVMIFFPNHQEWFIKYTVNIVFTIYAVMTVLWFAYNLIYSNRLSKLRKNLQLYICIVTFIQIFMLKKINSFEYGISVLIITYTYIQYLFENKTNIDEEKNKQS